MKIRVYVVAALVVLVLVGCSGSDDASIDETPQPTAAPTATRLPPNRGAVLTPTPTALTTSTLETIRDSGRMRVGVLYNYEPFSYLDQGGTLQGYEYDLLTAVAAAWDVEVEFVQVTRQTRLEMLLSGEIDVLAATTPQRRDLDEFVEFTDPIFVGGYGFLVNSGSSDQSLQQLRAGTLGYVNPQAGQVLEDNELTGIEYESYDVAVAAVQTSSVTGIVDRRENLMRVASAADGVTLSEALLVEEAYSLAVREGDTPLRDMLDLTLQRLDDEGAFSQIFSAQFYRYTADSYRTYLGESGYSFEDFPTEIEADQTVAGLREGEPLRVAGLTLDAEPRPFDGQTIVDGFNRAVINEMARRWNVPVEEISNSIGDAGLELLRTDQADIVVGITPQREFVGDIAFSTAYYQRGVRVAHLEDVTVNGIGDLDFRDVLALPPTEITVDLIEDNNGFPAYQETDQLEEAYEALLERGPTALVGDELTIILMSQSSEEIELVDERYRPVEQVMAIRASDSQLQSLVNYTLQDMRTEGVTLSLGEQYFAAYVPEGEQLPEPEGTLRVWPGSADYLNIGVYRPN